MSVHPETGERADYPTLPVSGQITAVLPVVEGGGVTLLLGSLDNKIHRVSTETRAATGTFEGHQHGVISLCMHSTNPNEFFSGSWDGTCRHWRLNPPSLLDTLQGHLNGVSVLHHSCGSLITSDTGSSDPGTSKLRVWNPSPSDGKYVIAQELVPHEGPIRSLCLPNRVDPACPVVTAGNDGQVTFVDVNEGGPVTRGVVERVMTGTTYLLSVDR